MSKNNTNQPSAKPLDDNSIKSVSGGSASKTQPTSLKQLKAMWEKMAEVAQQQINHDNDPCS